MMRKSSPVSYTRKNDSMIPTRSSSYCVQAYHAFGTGANPVARPTSRGVHHPHDLQARRRPGPHERTRSCTPLTFAL